LFLEKPQDFLETRACFWKNRKIFWKHALISRKTERFFLNMRLFKKKLQDLLVCILFEN